jgi:tetratricopeptide (TPR) repeat protein
VDFLDEYLELANTDQWDKALPLIEYIISLNPNFDTSWFNYGVCLDALNRNNDAAQAFAKAYKINQENYGAQYRIFRSLATANNEADFTKFLEEELNKTPEIIELLMEDEVFTEIISQPRVRRIIQNYLSTNN